METRYKWIGKIAASAGLMGVMIAASGAALADTYNIFLKDLPACATATGGFSFTKTSVTTIGSATLYPGNYFLQIVLTIPAQSSCMGVVNNSANQRSETLTLVGPNPFDGIVVQNPFSTTGDPQGLTVVGLNGTLTNGENGSNNYSVQFSTTGIAGCPTSAGCSPYASPTRIFTLYNNGASIFTGTYDVRNTAYIPEPETLWLALAGLSALALSRRKRRRS